MILPFFTNLPEDVIVNQFHFEAVPDDTPLVGSEIEIGLKAFYETVYGATAAARCAYIDWTRVQIKVFNLDDPTPRIPWLSGFLFTTAGAAATVVPTEVACVLSFHAEPESGVRFQRLYNRVYLGGLTTTQLTGGAADEFPRISSTFITAISNAARNLLDYGESSGANWVQVSKATGSPLARPIVGGWVDNSPDTQRRRSVLATTRNNWVPIP